MTSRTTRSYAPATASASPASPSVTTSTAWCSASSARRTKLATFGSSSTTRIRIDAADDSGADASEKLYFAPLSDDQIGDDAAFTRPPGASRSAGMSTLYFTSCTSSFELLFAWTSVMVVVITVGTPSITATLEKVSSFQSRPDGSKNLRSSGSDVSG